MANNISFNAPTVVNDVLYPKIVYNATFALAGASTNTPFAQNEIAPFSMMVVSGTVCSSNTANNGTISLQFEDREIDVYTYIHGAVSGNVSFYVIYPIVEWTTNHMTIMYLSVLRPSITWNEYNRFKFDTTPSFSARYLTGTVNIKFIQF